MCSQVLVASLAQAGQKILAESDCFELHLFLFNVIRCFLTCVINDILTLQPARSAVSPATSRRVPAVNAKHFDEPRRNLEPSQESVCQGESIRGMPSGTCHLGRLQELLKIHGYQKLSVQSYTDGCVGIIHILALRDAEMNYYSVLTWEEVLSYGKTWKNFENTMGSETSQSAKDKHSMAPLG